MTHFKSVCSFHFAGDTLHFSGHDLVDGTPVIDIKPYIMEYDCPSERQGTAASASVTDAPSTEDTVYPIADEDELDADDLNEAAQSGKQDDTSELCASVESMLSQSDKGLCKDPDPSPDGGTESDRNSSHKDRQSVKKRCVPDSLKSTPADDSKEQIVTSPVPPRSRAPDENRPVPSDPTDGQTGGDTWVSRLRPQRWTVSFTVWAESQLARFSGSEEAGPYRLLCLRSAAELRAALVELLTADPRSVYRRAQNDQLLYHLALDASHVTCWFDASRAVVEVLRLQPLADSPLAGVAARTAAEGAV